VLTFAKKPGNFILVIAAVFLITAFGLAIQPDAAQAAPVTGVGSVDFRLLLSQHPDAAAAQQTMKTLVEQTQKDFAEKSANMNDQDKRNLYGQMQQQLEAKEFELMSAIQTKIIAAVKDVADKKGLSVVIDKAVAIYGGEDITTEVGKKITGQ
jgi:outer membrane protein